MVKSILLVGIGGQGTILVSKILSEGFMKMGYDVKMSEIHGMAQRGGSVTTQIKFGDKVYSPVIGIDEADMLVSFEKAEAARYLTYLKKDGNLIVNDYEVYSLPVLIGMEKYPEGLTDKLQNAVPKSKLVNANEIAASLGTAKMQNIVLLGLIVKSLDMTSYDWESTIKEYLPEKLQKMNIAAFKKGLEL